MFAQALRDLHSVMHFATCTLLVTLLQLLLYHSTFASSENSQKPKQPCTIDSPTGSFLDLNYISLSRPEKKESWHAKGHDYGANFTINFCAPVIEDLEDVVGVEEARWQNISAYYRLDRKTYSIGWVDFLNSVMGKARGVGASLSQANDTYADSNLLLPYSVVASWS